MAWTGQDAAMNDLLPARVAAQRSRAHFIYGAAWRLRLCGMALRRQPA